MPTSFLSKLVTKNYHLLTTRTVDDAPGLKAFIGAHNPCPTYGYYFASRALGVFGCAIGVLQILTFKVLGKPAAKKAARLAVGKKADVRSQNKKVREDVDRAEMTLESRLGSLIQQDTITQLKSAAWKEPPITSLEEQVIALQELDIPSWGGKNVLVQQQGIEVVSHIASTATKFPMICIAGICERVAALKTRAQAMKWLTTFSVAMGIGFIYKRMSKIMKEHKNPKVLSEGLLWMVYVDDFGVAHLKLKDVFDFCKDATRNATIKLIGVLHKFVGPDIKAFSSDVKPAILSAVEAECEKNPFEGAAATPKKTIKASNSVSSVFGCGLDSLPREDNSRKITPELLKGLECSDWKIRSESIEAVLMFSFAPEAEGFFGDIGQEMVCKTPPICVYIFFN
ncbi:protein MOR1 [Tanacetum coccineum]|uniref:Protein MOR1 n=1 Tax=Tanacetum coccineum TaxID=301880 RepID=A0ABQ5CMD0_9ASTR